MAWTLFFQFVFAIGAIAGLLLWLGKKLIEANTASAAALAKIYEREITRQDQQSEFFKQAHESLSRDTETILAQQSEAVRSTIAHSTSLLDKQIRTSTNAITSLVGAVTADHSHSMRILAASHGVKPSDLPDPPDIAPDDNDINPADFPENQSIPANLVGLTHEG